MATAIVVRNNGELVRGVNRALDVTVSALQVAVTVALGLANQKIVLDKVTALNATTTGLIAGTAERLRTQGLLTSRWEDPSIAEEAGRPRRRLYTVTAAGAAALERAPAAEGAERDADGSGLQPA